MHTTAMKRFWWGVVTILYVFMGSMPASAIPTMPSGPNTVKTNGPLLITGYSFTGHSLRYVQVYNMSSEVASLNGWRVSLEFGTSSQTVYAAMSGTIAPAKYMTVANAVAVPSATIIYNDGAPAADPVPVSISLLAPSTSNFNNESVVPSITTSTPRVAGSPATFYFSRNVSASTGNYLSSFAAFMPSSNFTLASDKLYEAPSEPSLSIVEVYPDSSPCSPFSADMTCNDYVKIYNGSDAMIDLAQFRLRTGTNGQSVTTSNTVGLSGALAPGDYASFPLTLSASGSWVWLEDIYGTVRYDRTVVGYPSSSGHDGQSWSWKETVGAFEWTIYPTPGDQPNRFEAPATINTCDGLRINEIAANVATEDQFVEVINVTGDDIQLEGCLLQTNRSMTARHVFGPAVLSSGQMKTVFVKDTSLTLTKTTNGTVYILSSDAESEVDAIDYDGLSENTSWAKFADGWRQTYVVTPDEANSWLEYPPCDEGYQRNTDTGYCNKVSTASETPTDCGEGKYRNPETNRCRSLDTSASLTPCDSDQYRSSDTNRCRNLVSTASLLTPCAPGQERNPDTNRCRAAGSASDLKPCAANQERNAETNRCRNKTSNTTADFPVEAVAQTGQATMGWWAFGGVGMLAAGYAGWEWRSEVAGVIRKFGSFVKLGR